MTFHAKMPTKPCDPFVPKPKKFEPKKKGRTVMIYCEFQVED